MASKDNKAALDLALSAYESEIATAQSRGAGINPHTVASGKMLLTKLFGANTATITEMISRWEAIPPDRWTGRLVQERNKALLNAAHAGLTKLSSPGETR